MLLVEVLERRVLMEDIHALSLRENHPNRAVLKDQTCFTFQKNAHLLLQHQLDNQLCRLT
jgi:hypothetical protein